MKYTMDREPPEKRRGKHHGTHEEYFPEASVMLAFAMHLFERGAKQVAMHPDGMHVKDHDVRGWLTAAGFMRDGAEVGNISGRYVCSDRAIVIDFRAGVGDVSAQVAQELVIAECKGGIVNSRHNGQRSRLRKGICEAAGQLLGREHRSGERHLAVVPYTKLTADIAERMAPRAALAGIEFALVSPDGGVRYIGVRAA